MDTFEGEWDDPDGFEHEWEPHNGGTDGKHGLRRKLREMDAGLRCSICRGFLNVPLYTPCEHAFCSQCIRSALQGHTVGCQKCPVCAKPAAPTTLRALPQLGNLIQTFRNVRPLLLNEVKAGGEKLRSGSEYRLPVRNIDSMSLVDCRKLMRKYGLSESGSKEDMKARYRSLELKVNSEVDKCPGKIPSTQILTRLAKDVECDERKRNNTKTEIRKSKKRHCLWLENGETRGVCDMDTVVKADYRKLVQQAKMFKLSGRARVGATSTATPTNCSPSSEKGGGTTDMSNGGNMYEEEVMGMAGQWVPYSASQWSFCIPENFTPFFYNSDSGEWQLEVPEDVEADRMRMAVEGIKNTSSVSVPNHMTFIPTHKFLVMRNLASASPDSLPATPQDAMLEKSSGVENGVIASSTFSPSPQMNRTSSKSKNTTIAANLLNNVSHTCNENKSGNGSNPYDLDNTPNSPTNGEATTESIEVNSGESNAASDLTEPIWECTSCTFHNAKMDATRCNMCDNPRPTKSTKIQGRKKQTTIMGISSLRDVYSKRQKS